MSKHPEPAHNEQIPGFGVKEAITEAKRCLNCAKPLCITGCPIENSIPEFVAQVARGNIGEAYKIIAAKSNLPAVCGRVCPHELQCEGHCVLGKKGESVQIGQLERFIADFDYNMGLTKDNILPKTRGKVAVIGSGPAGLTVAGDLAKAGFHVTVYEAEQEPGGVLLYGIPAFRLPKEIVRREIRRIESLGVNFVTKSMVGKGFTVDDLFSSGYDAVFIGSGTAIAKDLDIPGKELAGIIQSSYLLRMITLFNSGQIDRKDVPLQKGDCVLVVGGGNVAMDTARSAVRMGAKEVTVVCRTTQENMAALKAEYESAVEDGVKFRWETEPAGYVGSGDTVAGLAVTANGEDVVLEADKVFLAIGSRPANRIVSTTEGIGVDEHGYVISCDRPYGMTTRKGVFAGGDVVHRPATVVLAMKEAKKVAQGIAAYVDAVKLLDL